MLIEMASLINPRSMSEILAQMSADRAEQLTAELASRAQSSPKGGVAVCPRSRAVPRSESAGNFEPVGSAAIPATSRATQG